MRGRLEEAEAREKAYIESQKKMYERLASCNGDVSYDEGSLQKVRTVTITMMDVECLRLI